MGILGRIFGTQEVIEKAADGIYNGIDAAILTDEERVQYHLEFLKAYEPFKLAQRLLAMAVTVPYVAIWVLSAILYTVSILSGWVIAEHAAINLAEMNNQTLGLPFAIILGFYFAGGAIEGVMGKYKQK